jgi:hypothetical protein
MAAAGVEGAAVAGAAYEAGTIGVAVFAGATVATAGLVVVGVGLVAGAVALAYWMS